MRSIYRPAARNELNILAILNMHISDQVEYTAGVADDIRTYVNERAPLLPF